MPGGKLPPNPGGGLAGTTWNGNETGLEGFDRLSFQFNANGQATMTDAAGVERGTWSQAGNNITINFGGGGVVYTGTLQGNRIQGTARNAANKQWNWSVTR